VTEPRLSNLLERLAERGELAPGSSVIAGSEDPPIGAVRYDSRLVAPGDLFVARVGLHADGHDHLENAAASGAAAALVERRVAGAELPQVLVRDSRAALGEAAAWRAGDPSLRLGVVGITGTDGKTTTGYLVRAILEASGRRTGLLGTTDVIVGGKSLGNDARTSTPEAPELQAHLVDMERSGDRWAVVESTSHGLAQQRVAGTAYDIAVLTNITSEHLDFHGTLEAYRAAKESLFARLAVEVGNPDKGFGKHAVINADDAHAADVTAVASRAGAAILRYGFAGRLGDVEPRALDIAAVDVLESPAGMDVSIVTRSWQGTLALRLAGRFNISNALAAMGVAEALGLDSEEAAAAIANVDAVPGRMQRIDAGQPFTVVVDYAHTADSLAKVLDELAPRDADAGLIVVFGSAGERDTQKRPEMGRVAAERCRLVVVTDEDPRGEDRIAILDAIASGSEARGMQRGQDLLVIPDRAEAIVSAISAARPGDAVLLAGKGHEKTIETSAGDIPWDESAVARDALAKLGYR
jgi:UDP-N-acetylmuramoyl-L-alanyl-D-glutamate--2,6-diaminopimelate ligase